MKISDVKVHRIPAPQWQATFEWYTSPMDNLFETGDQYRLNGLLNGSDMRTDTTLYVFVEITTDDGITGIGGIGLGSEAMAQFIEHTLRPLVMGENPFNVELL
jgi:L-alanine-DL-glutamate epimerase-like enolase superfamily enzyme